ncbi:hypothetical protein ACKI2N_003350 [Cupriavidus sp. 30B13]|uniref:hypothetical protein n=1 Tax=Cupriavidus sp. 30B13 TaxID=3384241 RepID=UPI003B920A6B
MFLPLPARQSAFFAYFLFGKKKVGRSGGAKAFDFDVEFKAFDFKAFDFEVKQPILKHHPPNPTPAPKAQP